MYRRVGAVDQHDAAVAEALRVLRPGGRFVFLDLFADPGHFASIEHVRAAIGRAGATVTARRPLADLLRLPFPLLDPKVLGHAVLISGVRDGSRAPAARG